MEQLTWIKSSKSASGTCVEVAHTQNGDYLMRDSKDPNTILRYTTAEWDAFLAGAKDGEFDF